MMPAWRDGRNRDKEMSDKRTNAHASSMLSFNLFAVTACRRWVDSQTRKRIELDRLPGIHDAHLRSSSIDCSIDDFGR